MRIHVQRHHCCNHNIHLIDDEDEDGDTTKWQYIVVPWQERDNSSRRVVCGRRLDGRIDKNIQVNWRLRQLLIDIQSLLCWNRNNPKHTHTHTHTHTHNNWNKPESRIVPNISIKRGWSFFLDTTNYNYYKDRERNGESFCNCYEKEKEGENPTNIQKTFEIAETIVPYRSRGWSFFLKTKPTTTNTGTENGNANVLLLLRKTKGEWLIILHRGSHSRFSFSVLGSRFSVLVLVPGTTGKGHNSLWLL